MEFENERIHLIPTALLNFERGLAVSIHLHGILNSLTFRFVLLQMYGPLISRKSCRL